MAVRTTIEPIERDIAIAFDALLSPAARSRMIAQFADEQIREAKDTNRQILGRIPQSTIIVDGRKNAPLASVKPDGVIVAEFELFNNALQWIAQQLELHSPRLTGRYAKSHTLFADGVETDVGAVLPDAQEFVFISSVPYARKIERGASSQAPEGVYQAVAVLAQKKFRKVAQINFTYRTIMGRKFVRTGGHHATETRNPAISVKVR